MFFNQGPDGSAINEIQDFITRELIQTSEVLQADSLLGDSSQESIATDFVHPSEFGRVSPAILNLGELCRLPTIVKHQGVYPEAFQIGLSQSWFMREKNYN